MQEHFWGIFQKKMEVVKIRGRIQLTPAYRRPAPDIHVSAGTSHLLWVAPSLFEKERGSL